MALHICKDFKNKLNHCVNSISPEIGTESEVYFSPTLFNINIYKCCFCIFRKRAVKCASKNLVSLTLLLATQRRAAMQTG